MNRYKYVGNENLNRIGIFTKSRMKIATGFNRIVHGGRGAYIEFDNEQILRDNLHISQDEKWRLNSLRAYYAKEYRSNCNSDVKIYLQMKTVESADYIIGKWYISPVDLLDFEIILGEDVDGSS